MTYVLIPGAGGDAWYWHLTAQELEQRGQTVIAVELPTDDEAAGLNEYADTVVNTIGDRDDDVVLVAQSMGGFVAPLVHERRPAKSIVLVNAMIPVPGETPGAWWANTGHQQARAGKDLAEGRDPDAEFDLRTYFFHDVPAELTDFAIGNGKPQADRPFGDTCRFSGWPATQVIIGRDDRFFPAGFQQRLARERLGVEPDLVPGGHLVALSHPVELVDRVVARS